MARPSHRSGLDKHGDWTPAFNGQRRPFETGNKLAERSGFFSKLMRPEDQAEVSEVASWLAEQAPARSGDAAFILLASMWVRWSRGQAWLLSHSPKDWNQALVKSVGTTENSMARLARGLGLTLEGAAQVGVDIAVARHVGGKTDALDPLVARLTSLLSRCSVAQRARIASFLDELEAEIS
jgi:hypothetical protein